MSPQTGTTTPGAPVTAVLAPGGTYTLFMFSADPGVGVATASGNPAQGWGGGWSSVSQGSTTPGAPVTAVLGPDGTIPDGIITLFMADLGGEVSTASGNPAPGWGEWAPVSPARRAPPPACP